MTLSEVGAYAILLCYDWQEGGLPDDEKILARWLRLSPKQFKRVWEVVRPNFVLHDGRWWNLRLEKERIKQAEWRAKSSRGGKAGAEARWHGGGHPVVMEDLSPPPLPNVSPNDDTSSSSSISLTTTTSEQAVRDELPVPKSPRPSRSRGLVPTQAESEVFAHYALRHPRAGPPDDDRIKKVRKGLASFSVDEMKLAIDGNLEDAWCVQHGKHEITWIFRNNDNIAKAIQAYHRANATLVGENGALTPEGQRYFGVSAA